jgi:hypothetical protein
MAAARTAWRCSSPSARASTARWRTWRAPTAGTDPCRSSCPPPSFDIARRRRGSCRPPAQLPRPRARPSHLTHIMRDSSTPGLTGPVAVVAPFSTPAFGARVDPPTTAARLQQPRGPGPKNDAGPASCTSTTTGAPSTPAGGGTAPAATSPVARRAHPAEDSRPTHIILRTTRPVALREQRPATSVILRSDATSDENPAFTSRHLPP